MQVFRENGIDVSSPLGSKFILPNIPFVRFESDHDSHSDEIFERLTKMEVSATYMAKGQAHKPTTLQSGMCGGYVFMNDQHCLKVGKAGSKSKAKWNSHHYNLDETTPSTLPKSIIKNKIQEMFSGRGTSRN